MHFRVSPQHAQLSVAERISELEKQQQQQQMKYTYLDPDKRHRVSDPTLKAIQKKALLSFYERHHQSSWRSEPQLAQGNLTIAPQSPPPQPPPKPRQASSRRASSASDYASGTWREKARLQAKGNKTSNSPSPKHQHSNSCGSLSTDLLGPVIVGPVISIDDWVPERPPKKPYLRNVYSERVPSPDLPPPSPPTVTESEVRECDDPLPPPPPELSDDGNSCSDSNGSSSRESEVSAKERKSKKDWEREKPSDRQSLKRTKSAIKRDSMDAGGKSVVTAKSPITAKSSEAVNQVSTARLTNLIKYVDSELVVENGVTAGFTTHRMIATGRSSLRYPSAQKLQVNGKIAPVRRVSEERQFAATYNSSAVRPAAQLPDLISQRYSDSGNQRPSPQVPVEPRIIRQESMRVDGNCASPYKTKREMSCEEDWLCGAGQRSQPQSTKEKSGGGAQKATRPSYLAIEPAKSPPPASSSTNSAYVIGSPVRTGYGANSKHLASDGNPRKYHEPPSYSYKSAELMTKRQQILPDKYNPEVANSPPPPLAPRQSTPGRKSLQPPPRPAPLTG